MCKRLIKVAMDDLKDAGMLADYAKESKGTEWENFFHNRAKQRLREYEEDRDWLKKAMSANPDHAWKHLEEYMEDWAEHIRYGMGGKG